jgi:hypothetical protein
MLPPKQVNIIEATFGCMTVVVWTAAAAAWSICHLYSGMKCIGYIGR